MSTDNDADDPELQELRVGQRQRDHLDAAEADRPPEARPVPRPPRGDA